MSQDQESDPRSPKAKASTSSIVLDALRTLTGTRPNRNSLGPLTSASPSSPYTDDALALAPPKVERTRVALRRAITDGTLHAQSTIDLASIPLKDKDFIGLPPELRQAVNMLSKENETPDRLRAAKRIANIMVKHEVPNVASIWARAEDLVYLESNSNAMEIGYKLLHACVMLKKLVARERVMFIEAILTDEREIAMPHRIDILRALTIEGRYLENIEAFVPLLTVKLIGQNMDKIRELKDKKKDVKDPKTTQRINVLHDYLQDLLNYVLAITKFNAKVLESNDRVALIEAVLTIARIAYRQEELHTTLDIIDAFVTYAKLPRGVIRSCLEIVCAMYTQEGSLRERAEKTLRILLVNHYATSATHDLLEIVADAESTTRDPSKNNTRGAILVLRLLVNPGEESGLKVPELLDLLKALNHSSEKESKKLIMGKLELVNDILRNPEMCQTLFEAQEWAALRGILFQTSMWKEHEGTTRGKHSHDSAIAGTRLDINPRQPHELSALLQQVINKVQELCQEHDPEQMPKVMDAIVNLLPDLDDSSCMAVIGYHRSERLLVPPTEDWFNNCQVLNDTTLCAYPPRHVTVRLSALQALHDAYNTAEALNSPDANQLMNLLMDKIPSEGDLEVLGVLCETAADVGTWTKEEDLFDTICGNLKKALFEKATASPDPKSPNQLQNDEHGTSGSSRNVILSDCFVRLFLRNLNRSGSRTLDLFSAIVHLANSPTQPPDARIIGMKLIARIRSDSNCGIYVLPETGCESVAAALCRTSDSVLSALYSTASPVVRPSRPGPGDTTARRQNQSTPATSHPTRANQPTRSVSSIGGLGYTPKPNPPLWMYGSTRGLPEDPPAKSSHLVFSHLAPEAKLSPDGQQRVVLPIKIWLELVLSMLQRKDLEWETYSYMLVHIGAQLTNHSLFFDSLHRVQDLTKLVMSQITSREYHAPPAHTNLKKSDVAICLYHVLTMLISYKDYLQRVPNYDPKEAMIQTFLEGVGTGERTAEICIHALSICCHELPQDVTRRLEVVIQKFAKVITQAHLAVHILEFLAGLARIPQLFSQFRDEDYSNVFSICIRYLEYVRDQRARPNRFSARSSRASLTAARTSTPTQPESNVTKSLADELPQYVYALAYHVIVFWFMSLRLRDRPRHAATIARKLMMRDEHGKQTMDEQGQVTLDFLYRITYSDSDETIANPNFAKPADGPVAKKSWVVGRSILTVETAGRTGVSQITRRRPSGTRHSIFQPSLVPTPVHQQRIVPEAFYSDDYVAIAPDDVLAEFYTPLQIVYETIDIPIPLADDDSTTRSISTFDRIPALDGHKVGIIYIGEGQTDEVTILANVMGSEDYTEFLSGIGSLIELQGATFNAQGLDREFNTDGKFTYTWRNRVTELVFHVTTMMPTNLQHDPQCSLKKRHTGNDFVNIIWNNSGGPFDFNTFPSDFNYVNIVIQPEARTSFVATRLFAAERARRAEETNKAKESESTDSTNGTTTASTFESMSTDLFYRVTVLTAPSIPPISAAATTKIISGPCLPAFVRLLALNASVFCHVWSNRDTGGVGEHVSSWRSRLREINRLRQRFEQPLDRPEQMGTSASVEFEAPGTSGSDAARRKSLLGDSQTDVSEIESV